MQLLDYDTRPPSMIKIDEIVFRALNTRGLYVFSHNKFSMANIYFGCYTIIMLICMYIAYHALRAYNYVKYRRSVDDYCSIMQQKYKDGLYSSYHLIWGKCFEKGAPFLRDRAQEYIMNDAYQKLIDARDEWHQ